MLQLISLLPYVVAFVIYVSDYRDLFLPLRSDPPTDWVWILGRSLLACSLTPLALAAHTPLPRDKLDLLLGASGVSVVLVVVGLSLFQRATFMRMKVPLGLGRIEVPMVTPAFGLFWAGTVVIVGCAAANLAAGSP